MSDAREKFCAVCGRRIEWRRKWARDWENVRYCSRACRARRLTPTDDRLESAILGLLEGRGRGKTICPSEPARRVGGDDWKPLMEQSRAAARRLAARGRVEITQKGRVVDGSTARGPVRIRLCSRTMD
ncbi:DUF3253 domain-containing protein [Lentisalinibacter salinarum]|uniref:DUF3253 domain-containing protein n=1 Tax=Lentisalinibacter salinarum TaxID=2992239 RepID=UPI003863AA75